MSVPTLPPAARGHSSEQSAEQSAEQSVITVALMAMVLGLVAMVIAPFASPLAWAAILGQAAWPVHRRVLAKLRGRRVASSLLTTGLVALALVLPMLWLLVLLQDELRRIYSQGQNLLAGSTDDLFDALAAVPWIGPALHDWLTAHAPSSTSVGTVFADWIRAGSLRLLAVMGSVGRNAVKFAFTILFLFFVFRDGEALLIRLCAVLAQLTGRPVQAYLRAVGDTSRAITLSVVLAAVIQGVMAALGYALVGLPAPILLGFITAIASILPVLGTFLIWGFLAGCLLVTTHWWQAIALLVWGTLLIHPVDNIVRPWIVSSAAHMPFLLALLGVLGGLAAFGFVGVFVGPVILAVGMVLWKEAADDLILPG